MTPLLDRPWHRDWLATQARRLIEFHVTSAGGSGGYRTLGLDGKPMFGPAEVFELHDTTRRVHVFAMAKQLGLPGLTDAIDQGMQFLWSHHRDKDHGGYFWSTTADAPELGDKRAYGHGHVLLAGASALRAGHPDAARLIADVTEVIETRFWEEGPGAVSEEYHADWSEIAPYRGQNANMHMAEALMAAFEATGEGEYLRKAQRIAERIINTAARASGWRVAEHFGADWTIDYTYDGDPMFRPGGTTPGHALEWSRLLIQLHDLSGPGHDWMVEAAHALFRRAVETGWNAELGGFHYTLDWDDQPLQRLRLWWPNAEAIGAAATFQKLGEDPFAAEWYERVWDVVADQFIDKERGGWFMERDEAGQPGTRIFAGKPDVYHSFQACLVPLLPAGTHLSGDLGAVRL